MYKHFYTARAEQSAPTQQFLTPHNFKPMKTKPKGLLVLVFALLLLSSYDTHAQLNADISVSQSSVPSTIEKGKKAAVRIRVYNTGNRTWSAGQSFRLGAGSGTNGATANQMQWTDFSAGGYMRSTTDARVYLSHNVSPGSYVDFRFNISGNHAGNRKLSVRMVQDGVAWFGEAYAWNINVNNPTVAPNNADISVSQSSVPSTIEKGKKAAVRIRVYNTGNRTWSAGQSFRLGAGSGTNGATANQIQWADFSAGGYMGSVTNARVYLPHNVSPGGYVDFRFNISSNHAGSRKLSVRMVQDGVAWFGEAYAWNINVNNPAPNNHNNGEVRESQSSVIASMKVNEKKQVRIRVYNNGNTTWSAGQNYRLGATTSNQVTWSDFINGGYATSPTNARAFLPHNVSPGGYVDFRFNISSVVSGNRRLSLRMVRDGVEWFGETQTWSINVGNVAPPPTTCETLFGVHWWAPGASSLMNGKKGWSVEIINAEGINHPSDLNGIKSHMRSIINDGFTPVVRLNWNWFATIPNPGSISYNAFADRCAIIIHELYNNLGNGQKVKWFQIGNEYNLDYEYKPSGDGRGAPASTYVAYYNAVYNKVKNSVSNGNQIKVLVGPVANWAPTAVDGTLGSGYYDAYYKAVVQGIGNNCDGYAIHTYGAHNNGNRSYAGGITINWGPDNHLGRAGNVLPAGFNKANTKGFRSYRVLMQIIDSYGKAGVPAIITETNTSAHFTVTKNSACNNPTPCTSGDCKLIPPSVTYYQGWMQQAYQEINSWNNAHSRKILGLCWFVYKSEGEWTEFALQNSNCMLGQARTDFDNTTRAHNYSGQNCLNASATQKEKTHVAAHKRISNVYPVPATNGVTVELLAPTYKADKPAVSKLEVKDMYGQLVLSKKVAPQQTKHYLKLEKLKSGIYTLLIYHSKGVETRRFNIKK
ncbi:hypothetical protein M23134_06370 [Microscilla marina ATCC 23134]|uniref:Secretion system C-terminal sorting domain-containing protein n=2 Tax=Microscilla marina TaxID=1027 RepID=A1ZU51_MICM2|nr:hypothetical protein M23134_06370 [Microscilla marina ATCC 23134]